MKTDPTKTELPVTRRSPHTLQLSGAVVPDHELIQRVGEGAFGEVWLARNVMDTARAVKLVRRSRFNSDEPYEREFSGIRKYEPISRSHDGLVDVLQVGRNDAEGYFYYVMELADDGVGEPNGYTPRTLRNELETRGRLPVSECVRIALSLSQALAHLHGHNLLHRDIKPSNLIFVGGAPKLADIGLVTDATEARTFVGTEGYIPPEGPNSCQADIYSLGMVLYEISSGKKAKDFPEPSLDLVKGEERAAWLELNAVILKACATDPRQRYHSAEEMHADLSLLQRGKSVMARHTRQRVLATTMKMAAVFSVLLTTAIVGCLVARRPVAEAGKLVPRKLLDGEAVFSGVNMSPHIPRTFDFSSDGERMVFVEFANERGVFIWERKTSVTRHLEIRGMEGWKMPNISEPVGIPRWAPDGRHFVLQPFKETGLTNGPRYKSAFFLVNADTGEARQLGSELSDVDRVYDWCWRPDGQSLTYVSLDGRFHDLSLSGGSSVWVDSKLPKQRGVLLGGYSPGGNWLLLSARAEGSRDARNVWIIPHLGGRAVPLTDAPGLNSYPTWGPEVETVYYVSAGGVRGDNAWGIWKLRIDLKTGLPEGPSTEVFVKKGQHIYNPKFVAAGRKLAYAVIEPDSRIWRANSEAWNQATEVARGQMPILSPDGKTIYFKGEMPEQQGVFAIAHKGQSPPRKLSDLAPPSRHFLGTCLNLSPDGELIAMPSVHGNKYGLFLIPTAGGAPRLIETLDGHEHAVWSPDGQWLAYIVNKSLYRVSRDLKVREMLATLYNWGDVSWSPDGKWIASLGYETPEGGNDVFVVSVADKQVRKLTPANERKYKENLNWHPDGQRLTYFYYDEAKHKWAYLNEPGRTEEMIDQEAHWDYTGTWSPDGRQFFFVSFPDNLKDKSIHIYDLATRQITHGVRDGGLPGWSRDRQTTVWAIGKDVRYFEELENFR